MESDELQFPSRKFFLQGVCLLSAFLVGLALGRAQPRLQRRLDGSVPLEAEANVSPALLEQALSFVPFQDWLRKLQRHRDSFRLQRVTVQSVDMFGKKVGFVKLKSEVYDRDGDPLAGICFLRGGSVAVLVILESEETAKEYCLQVRIDNVCTVQPQYMALPAGMLDGNGDFGGAMAREMEEETGIRCDAKNLLDMTALVYGEEFEGMYPSVGACDEFIRLFLFRRRMRQAEILSLEGKLMGLREENEKIKLCLVPLADLWHLSPDAKNLCALLLYSKLKEAGRLIEFLEKMHQQALRQLRTSREELSEAQRQRLKEADKVLGLEQLVSELQVLNFDSGAAAMEGWLKRARQILEGD
eukprot:s428_g7.t1